MKKSYIIIGITCTIIIVCFFAFKYNWFSGRKVVKNTIPTKETQKEVFPLKQGSNGPEVLHIQKALNKKIVDYKIFMPLAEDGIFGTLTEGMLFNFFGVKEVSQTLYKKI